MSVIFSYLGKMDALLRSRFLPLPLQSDLAEAFEEARRYNVEPVEAAVVRGKCTLCKTNSTIMNQLRFTFSVRQTIRFLIVPFYMVIPTL